MLSCRLLTAHSPYEILDLDVTATPEEIKKKYRQLSLCEHPAAAVFTLPPERCSPAAFAPYVV